MNRASIVRRLDATFPETTRALRDLRTRVIRVFARDIISLNRRPLLAEGEPWVIDFLRLERGCIEVEGWVLPPKSARPMIMLNDAPFASLEVVSRPDVARHFWQRMGAADGGFKASSPIQGVFANQYARISFANAPTTPHKGLVRDYFLLDPSLEGAFPSPEQRARVIGNQDPFGFRLSGATDFKRIRAAVEVVGQRSWDSLSRILDWGVGCGRLARYALRELDSRRFVGCDIDADNVAWCRQNLEGEYHHTNIRPPLPFPSDSFDLVYGLSVFTHLREPLQDEWLMELKRILRPGGLAVMTTHGQTAQDFLGAEPNDYVVRRDLVQKIGIFVSGPNSDLNGAVECPEEYVNVFHSTKYVREHWSRWFDVMAAIPGYIHTHDLVVLRRRKD